MRLVNLLLVMLTACQPAIKKQVDFADYVNPFVGTGGDVSNGFGNMFPGAGYPFGMIQLSPDNGKEGWEYAAGYHYPDSTIVGFSHTHLSGTGVGDYCDISVMPTTKPVTPKNFDPYLPLQYASKFLHVTEKASPGYYSVHLPEDNIDVELTTTELVGMHRYHFNKTADHQSIVLNLGYSNNDRTTDALVRYRSPELVTGYRFSSGKANVHRVYFAMQFSRNQIGHDYFLADTLTGDQVAKGRRLTAVFSFDPREKGELLLKVAISSVSEEGALANLRTAELFGWNFNQMHRATRDKWNEMLSKIKVTTADSEKKCVFYTSLYHTYLAPYRFSDVSGYYKNFRHLPEKSAGYTQYTLLSLWDTFRAGNPFLTLMQPQIEENIIHSMLAKYRQTGELPYWEISGNEGGSMIGYHAAVLMADAVGKKIGNYDLEEMYRGLVAVAETDRKGLDFYRKYHFVPADKDKNGTVSKTLEYAFDDWCIAQIAQKLGKTDDYRKYMDRSAYYKNLYDPAYHLMRGRNSDGSWYEPFHPRFAGYGNPHCVEGNTWQYSFFAPHDLTGLIDLMGGPNSFEMMLDSLFTQNSELLGDDVADVTGLIGQYSHGNEPDHNSAYLFNFVDKPEKTQFYTNQIINTLYNNSREGLCGNEDCGQMSAWYIFSSIGFYPVNPVDGKYYFGSPQFNQVTLELPNGNSFTVEAKNVSTENIYIKSVKLNGEFLKRLYVTYDEIQRGGSLEFEMVNRLK